MNEWIECDLSELRIQYRDRLADLGFAHKATMAAEAERDAAIACAERAEAAMAERDNPCVWISAGRYAYKLGCSNQWLDNATPFCPLCGHPVQIATSDSESPTDA